MSKNASATLGIVILTLLAVIAKLTFLPGLAWIAVFGPLLLYIHLLITVVVTIASLMKILEKSLSDERFQKILKDYINSL